MYYWSFPELWHATDAKMSHMNVMHDAKIRKQQSYWLSNFVYIRNIKATSETSSNKKEICWEYKLRKRSKAKCFKNLSSQGERKPNRGLIITINFDQFSDILNSLELSESIRTQGLGYFANWNLRKHLSIN